MSNLLYLISDMKPITAIQKEIVSLSKKLKPITNKQKEYAFIHCFEPFAKKTAKGIYTCSVCAHRCIVEHSLADSVCGCLCPNCGRRLIVNISRQKVFRQKEYYTIVTTAGGYQVLRHFMVSVNIRIGKVAEYSIVEVVQRWITPNGKLYTIALKRNKSLYYYDSWNFNSELELRSYANFFVYNINTSFIYPHVRTTRIVRRNGFKGDLYGLSYIEFFKAILSDRKKETLLKCGQINLFCYFAKRNEIPNRYWSAIKISLRNKYIISDANLWCDYIDLLLHFGKDISNRHYVCPADLPKEHDRLSRKKNEEFKREQIKEKKQKAIEQENQYRIDKAKFFGLVFSEGNILIRVLESVQEFVDEAEQMKHCVFSNEYFKKKDSLILSASVDGVKIETIEVSLETMEIVQCRGAFNQNSEYHDEILRVMNNNIYQIANRMSG